MRASTQGSGRRYLLEDFELDPELAPHAAPEPTDRARAMARVFELDPGHWDGEAGTSALACLVVAGFLLRRVELAGRHSVELLGPGDLIRPGELDRDLYEMVPSDASWRALDHVRLAVLGERFARDLASDPSVLEQLLGRLQRRSRTMAIRLAIVQLPSLTARLYFLFWHLADRFGRVERDAVLLPIPLSHGILAELVSVQRPSVSRAMKELEHHGLVTPAPGGGWRLSGRPLKASGVPSCARRTRGASLGG